MKLTMLAALALLGGCAYLTSPNARYSYQRTGADCTLTVDSGRVFASGPPALPRSCSQSGQSGTRTTLRHGAALIPPALALGLCGWRCE